MRCFFSPLLLFASSVQAFQVPLGQRSLMRAPMTATVAETVPFSKPERVIPEVLPNVYVYDHCPFCVRVRFALGVKNIKHNIRFMANDDVPTPTALVGKKIAPIFEWPSADICMAESLDIISLVDSDERFGPTGVILPATDRADIKAWQKSVQGLLRILQRPRYVATGLLPEFQQLDGRQAFIMNHPLPPYEKAEWKEMGAEERLSIYAETMAKDPADEIEELNRKLVELDDIIFSQYHCSPGGLSYDDIDLFARLRSITIIKDVIWPSKLRAYMDVMSELGDIPLYDEMAL
ncbi:glutaredoxin 2 [Fistulifera solaris]|uniref:Glutaredoxin 2 n=1 Tax=Fistulifera solaris TaxID=1519565 RepID=A0A1Z5K1V3_FISSO|nr:glutaredoxin 2 [Fistulifera solaris]|eukprot:GAX20106.1 glutaredoxin 2 [Fistulifera solaris]